MWQEEFVAILSRHLRAAQEKNPRFSLRAFARKARLSPGAISDLLGKKRDWKVSEERALQILDLIEANPSSKNRILALMGHPSPHPTGTLEEQGYEILKDWTYFPILFSFDLPEAHHKPSRIAARLGLSEAKVRAVINDLLRRKLLRREKSGRLRREPKSLTATADPGHPLVTKHHALNLQLAEKALEEIAPDRRDFTSLTFAGSEKLLPYLRKEIRKLHRKAPMLMDGGEESDRVYRLCVQLYPVERKP